MKTLTCLSAWLGLLPRPLDQALRLPLQKNKSLVISRKWGNVTDTIIGSLSNDDGDVNENNKKALGLDW